jgi:Ni/Co efflux regulator RcnB
MKRTLTLLTALTLLAGTGTGFAQGYDPRDNRDNRGAQAPATQNHDTRDNHAPAMQGPMRNRDMHADWRKGGHIARDDWGRGMHVDYRAHHLRRPPRGYEWRQVDGNYVLAAVTTGLIASIILAGH